jgi:hypothetical protein
MITVCRDLINSILCLSDKNPIRVRIFLLILAVLYHKILRRYDFEQEQFKVNYVEYTNKN